MYLLPVFMALYGAPKGSIGRFGKDRDEFKNTIECWMIRRRDSIVKQGGNPTISSLLQGTDDSKFKSMCEHLGISPKDVQNMAKRVLEKSIFGGYDKEIVKGYYEF